ncbi:PREDICTED: POU domain, class 4, transcription factor 1 [Chaetura pelagica]|uniref:POU domain, class 4, transcription factor 1 n=1 Tax=Chaetura pelagica TaxID=8897 RepID=UPI000523B929|nr:PREDICTED: POU domain, class 4, transcription factor 1 [Chaetura pelagica]
MMSMNSKQPHFAMHPTLPEHKYPSLHSSSEAIRRACLPTPPLQSNIFASLDETLLARAEALAAVALPILQAWLEEAEGAQREKMNKPELFNGGEKKRKRTSIAAPEKRSLEAYFAVQPRPSSEKIAAIAEKLDLKKNVVRVWFCNQRQKQKRMKFSATY